MGFDGSETAQRAVRWAAGEARVRGRGLTLLHAILPPVTTGGLGVGLPPSLELIQQLEAHAKAQLDALADEVRRTRCRHPSSAVGAPSGVMLEASEQADLVVIGSRGRGGFAGLLLGSVSAQVAAHAECPVAVIRQDPAPGADTVVVGDRRLPGIRVRASGRLRRGQPSRLGASSPCMLGISPPTTCSSFRTARHPCPLAARGRRRDPAGPPRPSPGFRADYPDVEVEERLVRAPAVKALITASDQCRGDRGRQVTVTAPPSGCLLGSVSNGLLHKAKVPVIVVPPRPSPGPRAA